MSEVRERTRKERPPREVFEDLVARHHVVVYRTALRVTRRDADARDVTQRVFLAVLEGQLDLARAEDPARVLRSWAARAALAHLRGARNARRREEHYAMRNGESRVDRTVEEEEERHTLARLVGALPEDLRVPVELRFREQWTLAEIGAALEISEPSVHERLKRALDGLRRELGKLGFSAFAARIEVELARDTTVLPPAGLAPKLLALHGTASGFAALPALAIGAAIALVITLAVWITGLWTPTSETTVAGRDAVESASSSAHVELRSAVASATEGPDVEREPAAGTSSEPERPAPQRELAATVHGRVVDEFGLGVGGATVRIAPPGKGFPMAEKRAAATTRPDGSYTLELALREPRETLQLAVEHTDFLAPVGPVLRLSASAAARAPEVTLARAAVDPLGDFTLALRVVAHDGAPVSAAPVRLFRRGKSVFGGAGNEWEAGGVTDADGRIELTGKYLGEKLLVLDARDSGWRMARERVTIRGPGRTEHVLRADRGAVLAGTVRALDGTPLADRTVSARPVEDDGVTLVQSKTDAAGRYELVGLDPVQTRVTVEGGGHSDARVEVTPSRTDLDFVLKLSTDPTDVGDHMAELHGVVVDARTRAPVPVGYDAIDVVLVRSTSRAEFLATEAAALLVERPVQTMFEPGWTPPSPSSAFHATGLSEGTFVLVARAAGHAPSFAGPFELGPSTLRAGIELPLEPGTTVVGRVLDARGAAVKGALVVLAGEVDAEWLAERDREVQATEGHPRYWYDASRTDAEGRYTAIGSPGLRVRAVVFAHGRAPSVGAPVELRPGESQVDARVGSAR